MKYGYVILRNYLGSGQKIVDPLAKLFIGDNKKNNLKCKSYRNGTLKLQN